MLLLVSITLVALDHQVADGKVVAGVRSAVTSGAGPVQRTISGIDLPFAGSSGEQDRLRRDNDRLREQLRAAQVDESTAEQLRELNLLAGTGGYQIRAARVVALSASSGLEWTVTLGVGSREGVRPGMTVINGDGLVGRVKRTSNSTCVVLLAIDRLSAVGSRVASSGELGLTKGDGQNPMRLQLLDPQAGIAVGDRLVTGPYGQSTFAANVPIGRVTKVSGAGSDLVRTADIEPYVNFTALDVVGVVLADPGK